MKAEFHANISITIQRPVHVRAKSPLLKACFINFVFRFSGHFESDLSHSAAAERLRVRGTMAVEGNGAAVEDADVFSLLVTVSEDVGGRRNTLTQQLEGRPDALTRLKFHLQR